MIQPEPVISVAHLQRHYARGKVQAVRDISFDIPKGSIFGLIGPDGAGKTSVVQMLAGVLRRHTGEAQVAGYDVFKHPEKVKQRIGYMPQGLGLNLYDSLSVKENIEFFRDLRQVPADQFEDNFDRLLNMTRLSPFLSRPAGKLSGGMRQKLALICTLIHLPDILLLDEPTTGVDPISRRDFWAIIHELVTQRQVSVLLTTSYMDEAERCHRVALMNEGQIIAEGEPQQLVAEFDRSPTPGRNHVGLEDVFIASVRSQSAASEAPSEFRLEAITGDGFEAQRVFQVEALSKHFGDFVAIDQVSMAIEAGEIVGLLGPNGAGKTTLIKMLCGLLEPTSGNAEVAECDVRRQRQQLRHRIGYMSQKFSLYRDLSVRENMRLFAQLYGLDTQQQQQRIKLLLDVLRLDAFAQRVTGSLPLGLRQRLALACALIHEPRVLFLDEPTSGVDPIARRQFWQIVHELAQQNGIAVLVSTHYMDEAENCDRLGFMHQGRLIVIDTPDQLIKSAERAAGQQLVVDVGDYETGFHHLLTTFPNAMLYGRRIQWQSLTPDDDLQRAEQLLSQHQLSGTVTVQTLSIEETFVHFIQQANLAPA